MEIIFENIQKKMFSLKLLTLFILFRLGYLDNNLNSRHIKNLHISGGYISFCFGHEYYPTGYSERENFKSPFSS